jgi:hypothetical protein
MSKISRATRRELVMAIQDRYRSAPVLDKQRILDELVAVTGYHRKYAIRVLGSRSSIDAEQRAAPPRQRIYGEAVGEALGMLWEAADRICGKRLKPLLPTLVAALERHGHLSLDPVVRERVLTASAATIDRLLATRRATAGGRRRRPRARSAASRGIPSRSFGDSNQPEPGALEIDLVAHRGDHIGGGCAGLETASKDGEIRATHRAGPKPPRHWRTRKDPFEAVWPRVVAWLESEPAATAKGLLRRLQSEAPGTFPDGLLRTLQRRVKEWRHLAARHLVFASATSAIPEALG